MYTMYRSKRGFNKLSDSDIKDALVYYCEIISECNYPKIDHLYIKKISRLKYDYAKHIEDVSSWGGVEETGWLLDVPKKDWANELQSAYSRDFEHIIKQYESKTIRPAILIDGMLCDGRGRSMFLDAIGEKVPYVEIEVENI